MKIAIATILLFVLISSLIAGLQAVEVAEAYSLEPNPPPQITPPTILINSPKNGSIFYENSLSLVFGISAPDSVESVKNQLTNIYCQGDWQTKKHQLYDIFLSDDYSESFDFLAFNISLSNIPQGTHMLQIWAQGTVNINRAMFGYTIPSETNDIVIFTINPNQTTPNPTITPTATPTLSEPTITIHSPLNQTYFSSNIALNFTVIEPAEWYKPATGYYNPLLVTIYGKLASIVYTLDGTQSENVSIAGADIWTIGFGTADKPVNRTFSFNLTDLSSGQHSLQVVVYGLLYVSGGTSKTPDEPVNPVVTAPVMAYSPTINFAIANFSTSPHPSLSPSITPNNSPTQQPTLSPSPSSIVDVPSYSSQLPYLVGISLIAIGVAGLLSYFKKRK